MKEPKAVDFATLIDLLKGPDPPRLIDVRLEEDFNAGHLPGAVNNCVFEVTFLTRIPALAPDPRQPVCLYGADAGSLESRMAAEKLHRRGYTKVLDFRDGVEGWLAGGQSMEGGTATLAPATPADGKHPIDLAESRVGWTGRNLLNRHDGFVALKSGTLEFRNGQLIGGEFVLDMQAITCTDLTGDSLHEILIRHLLDHDFFDVGLFPEARFVLKSADRIPQAGPGAPNLVIRGELTLKDVTHEVEFEACAGITAEGKPAAQASFSIDRTRWNVFYGSGKWFRNLGGHLVNDQIELQLRIVGA